MNAEKAERYRRLREVEYLSTAASFARDHGLPELQRQLQELSDRVLTREIPPGYLHRELLAK